MASPAPATEDPDLDAMLGALSADKLGAAAAGAAAAAAQQAQAGDAQAAARPGQPQQINKEDFKHYVALYPCYVNPKLSVAQGRRVPLHLAAGCDDPWPQDIAEACARLGFKKMVLEVGKRHPRDQWAACQPARLRVELKDRTTGALAVPSIGTKDALLRACAPLIPGLPSRHARIEHIARQREAMIAQAQQQAAANKAAAGAAGGGGGGGGKKGDKALTAGGGGAAGGKGAKKGKK